MVEQVIDTVLTFKIILGIIATEALIELWKKAAPLQGIKRWLIDRTPFLHDTEQGHLLACPYCSSVWLGAAVMVELWYADTTVYLLLSGALSIHRLSNFLHIVFSLMRDKQIDLRINRRR